MVSINGVNSTWYGEVLSNVDGGDCLSDDHTGNYSVTIRFNSGHHCLHCMIIMVTCVIITVTSGWYLHVKIVVHSRGSVHYQHEADGSLPPLSDAGVEELLDELS